MYEPPTSSGPVTDWKDRNLTRFSTIALPPDWKCYCDTCRCATIFNPYQFPRRGWTWLMHNL